MLLRELADVSSAVAAEASRKGKTALLAELFARLDPDEIGMAVSWLSGQLTQRQIGVGWASLRDTPAAAVDATLTIAEVESTFDRIGGTAGRGSKLARTALLSGLMAGATAGEQVFLRRLLAGELRQGALGSSVLDAVARTSGVPIAAVRRAAMLTGDPAAVARLAVDGGTEALAGIRLQVGRPVQPMLAKPAGSVPDALARLGRSGWEQKLDGARIQVHRNGAEVSIFTRTLDDVTARLPEICDTVRGFPATAFVLDGEAMSVTADGRPLPFQVTAARFGTRSPRTSDTARLNPYFFDILHLDGQDLIDEPGQRRADVLADLVPPQHRVRRIVTAAADEAQRFYDDVLASTHEGVVAKSLDAPYEAGRRGGAWLKVKPVHTLDLVVLAVEWGSGRRKGFLSNIHLGARDPGTGELVMLGKTFKGMTDEMLAWQTKRFGELATDGLDGWVVRIRPEQVVEIAFDGVQRSSRYPGGVALRFARVVRYRDDKPVSEIDSVESVRALLK